MQETDFLNGDVDNDSNSKVTKSCSNDAGDDDDARGGEGAWKADCGDEADDDDGDNDNGGVDDDCGVDNGNDANGGDKMSKAGCDDDADGGDGNSNDDGSADGDSIFENWCVDGEGGDDTDDGDEQTGSVARDLAECNGSSKMEMTVGLMW